MTMFKTYKERLNKSQLKQFEQIENNIKNIIITDDNYLKQLDTFIDKKIKTLKSEKSKQFYLDAKKHIHSVSSKIKKQDELIDITDYPNEYDPLIIKKDDIAPLLNKNEDVFISYDPKATLYNLLNDRDNYILPKLKKEPSLTEKQNFLKAIMPCTGVVAPITYIEINDNQIRYIFKNSGPHYVIATGQPTKTYPTLTLFAITLENPHFYYTKEKCEKLFTDKLNQLS